MPTRERYVRCHQSCNDEEVTIGLSYELGDDVLWLMHQLDLLVMATLSYAGGFPDMHERAVSYAEEVLDREYPGRPFFIETEHEGGGLQVYQPWGMPRGDCE